MADGKRQHGKHNHDALQDNEVDLALHELVSPATSELRNAVHAAGEDGDVSESDGAHEGAELGTAEELHGGDGELVAMAVGADSILDEEVTEETQADNLPDDTCDHEVRADVLEGGTVVGGSGDATACTLEDEGQDVTADEEPGVPVWSEAGPAFAEVDDDVLEGEVDACSDEGGRDDQTADLDLEAELVPGVVPEENAAYISDAFT